MSEVYLHPPPSFDKNGLSPPQKIWASPLGVFLAPSLNIYILNNKISFSH